MRSECLDHLLIMNEAHLERILRSYGCHYNGHRPHQGLSLEISTFWSDDHAEALTSIREKRPPRFTGQ
ncbi:MAG: hypothetical protein ACLP5O_10725 [Acidimicrobiales bacterium]